MSWGWLEWWEFAKENRNVPASSLAVTSFLPEFSVGPEKPRLWPGKSGPRGFLTEFGCNLSFHQ